jgi:hypothetical protein
MQGARDHGSGKKTGVVSKNLLDNGCVPAVARRG